MKILKPGQPKEWKHVGLVLICGHCKCQFQIEREEEVKEDAGLDASGGYHYVNCPTCRQEITIWC